MTDEQRALMTAPPLRIAHVTDTHVIAGPHFDDRCAVLSGIADRAVELGVQATIISGDVYGGHTVPYKSKPPERTFVHAWVARFAQLGPVVVIPGNHDYPGDLDALANIGGGMGWPVVVANRPQIIDLRTSGADLRVYPVPWPTARVLLGNDDAPSGPEALRQLAGAKLDKLLELWSHQIRHTRQAEPDVVHVLAAHCMISGGRTSGGEILSGRDIEVSRPALERLGVDYGALGHLHCEQAMGGNCHYGGDPYPVDFGETEEKTWNVVDVGAAPTAIEVPGAPRLSIAGAQIAPAIYNNTGHWHPDRHTVTVHHLPTGHRRWITLDWEWGSGTYKLTGDMYDADGLHEGHTEEIAGPGWSTRPTAEQLALVDGANVRARLTVSAEWRKSCPWDRVLADLRDRGAHSIQPEVNTIPVHRVRAPEVASAATLEAKCEAFWATLDEPPGETDQATALGLLQELRSTDDETIHAATAALMPRAER